MIKPEVRLQNQVKKVSAFIHGIDAIKNPIVLGGVQFFLDDLKCLSDDMELTITYVALDIESLRRENYHLRKLGGEGMVGK